MDDNIVVVDNCYVRYYLEILLGKNSSFRIRTCKWHINIVMLKKFPEELILTERPLVS